MLPIAKEGFPFIAIGLTLILFALLLKSNPLIIITVLLTIFVVFFFRDPERIIPTNPGLILSPADGKVVEIVNDTYNNLPYTRISIFLSVFNVHINRAPLAGTVKEKKYNPGKFLVAMAPKASEINEQTALVLSNDKITIVVKQIAGLIARRIVCWPSVGDKLEQGQRFGLIRFGSRADVFLPSTVDIKVKIGDKVAGGTSVLGVIK